MPKVEKSTIIEVGPPIDIAPTDPAAKPFDLTELDAMITAGDSAGPIAGLNVGPVSLPPAVPVDPAVAALIDSLRVEVDSLRAQIGAMPSGAAEGIFASTIGVAYCSICGLRLDGGSPTGLKGQLYLHPFGTSPVLGTSCQYNGRSFKPPVVFLELVPKPERKP